MSTARPLILLGIDGGTLDLVLPWVDEKHIREYLRGLGYTD